MQGIIWMMQREIAGTGGILAYDMGFGKTRMCITLMLAHDVAKTLIITTPTSINEWVYQLSLQDIEPLIIAKDPITRTAAENHKVFLTTYNTLLAFAKRVEKGAVGEADARWFRPEWSRVILDEGHAICSQKTETFKCMSNLKVPRLGMVMHV